MLDVNKQLKLKFNPLFEKPRRPNLHRLDLRRNLEHTDKDGEILLLKPSSLIKHRQLRR